MMEVFDSVDQLKGRTVNRTLIIINFYENIMIEPLFSAIAFFTPRFGTEQSADIRVKAEGVPHSWQWS